MNSEDNGSIFFPIADELRMVDQILIELINGSPVPLIKEAANHIILSGGKRIRPALIILAAGICGYKGGDTAYLGAAVELIHTASLIHDDVLDGAETRRGVGSANARWGNHISILVGDYCLSLASYILSTKATPKIISLLTEAAKKTTEGEVMEIVFGGDLSMDEETYLDIIKHKTAFLISSSCEAGGIIADAPARLVGSLKSYGLNLGMAFQIIDDVLDYTSEESSLGKKRWTDLKEGKLTLPLIYAIKRSEPKEKEIIKESLLAPTYSEERFKFVSEILDKYACTDDSRRTAKEFATKAAADLEPFRPSIEKDALLRFADFVLNRSS